MALDVSAYSLIAVTREVAPLIESRGGGSVLTLTYLGSQRVFPNYNVMGVAKAALEASVRYLAADLGPKNIRVNAISAGPIKTLAASGIGGFSSILQVYRERSPLRRNTETAEVADAARFLLGPPAAASPARSSRWTAATARWGSRPAAGRSDLVHRGPGPQPSVSDVLRAGPRRAPHGPFLDPDVRRRDADVVEHPRHVVDERVGPADEAERFGMFHRRLEQRAADAAAVTRPGGTRMPRGRAAIGESSRRGQRPEFTVEGELLRHARAVEQGQPPARIAGSRLVHHRAERCDPASSGHEQEVSSRGRRREAKGPERALDRQPDARGEDRQM